MTATATLAEHSDRLVEANRRTQSSKLSSYKNYWRIACDLLGRCTIKPLINDYFVTELTIPGKDSLTVQYVGDGAQYSYVLGLVFAGNVDSVEVRSRTKLSFQTLLKRDIPSTNADLSVIDLDFPLQRWLKIAGVAMPHWLKQKISLGSDWDQYLSGMRRKTRREAQRMIRKFELTTQLVSGEVYGATFYDELYQPYISSRHGDSSVIIERDKFLAKIKLSQVMQLIYQGEVLAAAQIDTSGSTLSLGWTGIADREENELRGAADALDYFCVKHAFDSGCESVDMGHSRPVLSDGILRYKKKWRASVNTGVVPQGSLVFRANKLTPACRQFYERNTLLSKGSDGLQAHLLVHEDADADKDSLSKLIEESYIEGLAKIVIYSSKVIAVTELPSLCELEIREYKNESDLLRLLRHPS